jgi:hypothetical protein
MVDGPALPPIRSSDAEREHCIDVLRDAVVHGRLTLEEFSDRVGAAQVTRTDRDLAQLTVDLPSVAVAVPQQAPAVYRATFSKLVRRGAWELPADAPWLLIRVSGPGGTLYVRPSESRPDPALLPEPAAENR